MYKSVNNITITPQMEERWKELESYIIYDELSNHLNHFKAVDLMSSILELDQEQSRAFNEFIMEYRRLKPTSKERTIYLRSNNISYRDITKHHGVSPNYIKRYLDEVEHEGMPIYRRFNAVHDLDIFKLLPLLKIILNISHKKLLDVPKI